MPHRGNGTGTGDENTDAILTKGVDYDPKKMVGDIKRPAVYLQAA